MFTAALFTRAETWKQPKHPSKDEGISQDVRYIHIHTRVCIHIIEKESIPFVATQIQLEIIMLSELGQKEKDKYHIIPLLCGLENIAQMNLSIKQ